MRKEITTIILLLFSISLISAVTIYTGDSYTKTLDEPYHHYEITENTSEVNVEISQVGNLVTVTPDKSSQNVSFTITFYDEEDEPISSSGSSGDGGSSFVPKKKTTDNSTTETPETTNTPEQTATPTPTPKDSGSKFLIWLIIIFVTIVVGTLIWLSFRDGETPIEENTFEPIFEDSNTDAREEEQNE